MYIHPLDKKRIKDVMRTMAVNKNYLSREQIRKFKKEFAALMRKYPGIDFHQVAIMK